MKKTLLGLLILLLTAGGIFFFLKGQSHYDPKLFSLEIRPADKPFGIGSEISLTLPDQFDKSHTLSPETRTLVFAFSKNAGHIVRAYMTGKDERFLKERKAVIVADISKMPTVIFNTFALPDLQKSHYPMLLIHDEKMAQRLEQKQPSEKVVVMRLENGKVSSIEYAADEAELAKLMQK